MVFRHDATHVVCIQKMRKLIIGHQFAVRNIERKMRKAHKEIQKESKHEEADSRKADSRESDSRESDSREADSRKQTLGDRRMANGQKESRQKGIDKRKQ